MENRHCDDVTERIFKIDILFSLEVMLGQKVKINYEVKSSYRIYCLENLMTSFNGWLLSSFDQYLI